MKTLPSLLLILLATCLPVHAGLILREKREVAQTGKTGTRKTVDSDITIKIEGDRTRVDRVGSDGVNQSRITDFKTFEMLLLKHADKSTLVFQVDPAAHKKDRERKLKETPKLRATGRKEKVGDFNAEIYEATIGGKAMKLWVAADFPNAKGIKEQAAKFFHERNAPVATCNLDLPGMVVKVERGDKAVTVTATLLSAKEVPVADDQFKSPEGYTRTVVPKSASPPPGDSDRESRPALKLVPLPKER